MNGAATRIRTRDLLITNQLLYQLSYGGEVHAQKNVYRDDSEIPILLHVVVRAIGGVELALHHGGALMAPRPSVWRSGVPSRAGSSRHCEVEIRAAIA